MSAKAKEGNGRNGIGGAAGLRARRVAAGFSQQHLAELAGCSISIVRFYEAGHRATPETLGKLASALGCDPADLRNDERRPHEAGAVESRGRAGQDEE
jgi:transcriptional regulator with XRE-family HTH domain